MAKVKNDSIAGWPNTVMPRIRQKLQTYIRRRSSLKIGITGNPRQRAATYHLPYTEMVLLYRTTSESFIRNMEKVMVDEYWSHCDNTIGGGGGPLSDPPYYLYIVHGP